MMTIPNLQTSLLDILHEIQDTDIKLIIGGGYGIYLKIDHQIRLGEKTLFNIWPEPRSTNDLDIFLRPELLIKSEKLKPLAEAINRLGYEVVDGAEKYQFVKHVQKGFQVKIDFLTGQQSCFQNTLVKADNRRARPNPSVGIHAHPVNEVPTLEDELIKIMIEGKLSSGNDWKTDIFLPHPYTFLMMKLFAFNDRLDDDNKEFGRYHALDMYSILATTIDTEWEKALKLKDQYRDEPYVIQAKELVVEHFSSLSKLGIIRLKESAYFRPELQLNGFIETLKELFL